VGEQVVRIHHLGRQLQVEGQTIIERCRKEGVAVKNHMHVVSPGLEAKIRGWFGGGDSGGSGPDFQPFPVPPTGPPPARLAHVARNHGTPETDPTTDLPEE
jgi:hypothetical protein